MVHMRLFLSEKRGSYTLSLSLAPCIGSGFTGHFSTYCSKTTTRLAASSTKPVWHALTGMGWGECVEASPRQSSDGTQGAKPTRNRRL